MQSVQLAASEIWVTLIFGVIMFLFRSELKQKKVTKILMIACITRLVSDAISSGHCRNNRKANIPIVAMTANAFDEDRRKAFECGMNGHIVKPIDMKAIAAILDQIFSEVR